MRNAIDQMVDETSFNIGCVRSSIEDKSDMTRVIRCSSLKPCFSSSNTFDESMCSSKRETCAIFKNKNGIQFNGCILKKFCAQTGIYEGRKNVFICPKETCPDYMKRISNKHECFRDNCRDD